MDMRAFGAQSQSNGQLGDELEKQEKRSGSADENAHSRVSSPVSNEWLEVNMSVLEALRKQHGFDETGTPVTFGTPQSTDCTKEQVRSLRVPRVMDEQRYCCRLSAIAVKYRY